MRRNCIPPAQSSESNHPDASPNAIRMADHFRLRRFERLLGGYPVEPALLRQFFVVGKIELNQQVDARRWLAISRLSSALFGLGLRARGFLLSRGRLLLPRADFEAGFSSASSVAFPSPDSCAAPLVPSFLALELQRDLVAQTEGLFPRFEFVPRLLCCFFVRAEIENQNGLRHTSSIAARRQPCQARSVAAPGSW